jgi:hypothetical protein
MRIKILLVAIWLVGGNCGNFKHFKSQTETSTISKATIDIISKSFLENVAIINIITCPDNDERIRFLMDTIANEVCINISSLNISLRVGDLDHIPEVKEKRFYNIILISGYESFKKLNLDVVENELFDFQGFFLVVMVEKYKNQYREMEKIFQSMWQNLIINVNILLVAADGSLEMFTFYPYTSVYCGRVFPILTNKFVNSSFIMPRKYFEDKLDNLFGCPLKVVTFNIAPMMFVNEEKNGNFSFTGIDGELLKGNKI